MVPSRSGGGREVGARRRDQHRGGSAGRRGPVQGDLARHIGMAGSDKGCHVGRGAAGRGQAAMTRRGGPGKDGMGRECRRREGRTRAELARRVSSRCHGYGLGRLGWACRRGRARQAKARNVGVRGAAWRGKGRGRNVGATWCDRFSNVGMTWPDWALGGPGESRPQGWAGPPRRGQAGRLVLASGGQTRAGGSVGLGVASTGGSMRAGVAGSAQPWARNVGSRARAWHGQPCRGRAGASWRDKKCHQGS